MFHSFHSPGPLFLANAMSSPTTANTQKSPANHSRHPLTNLVGDLTMHGRSHSLSIPIPSFVLQLPAEPENVAPMMKLRADTLHRRNESLSTKATFPTDPVLPSLQETPSHARSQARTNNERKSPRRTYFDYGLVPHPLTGDPPSQQYTLKPQDSHDSPNPFFSSHTRFMSSDCSTLSWQLPSPSPSRMSKYNRRINFDKENRFYAPLFRNSQSFWLVLYFSFNLGLTLYNKGVLIHFPFAYTLTALHALCGSIGGVLLLQSGAYIPAKLTDADNLALIAFSVLYTVNIAVSNLSLQLVTIPFHQVVRAATPIFIITLSTFLFGARCSRQKITSLIPVIAGVGLATYGDYYCTTPGLLLTILGTLLAAVKTIFTSILQSPPSLSHPSSKFSSPLRFLIPPRLHLHPLDLLTRMAPMAFVQCVLLAHMTGELDRVRHWSAHEMSPWRALALLLNGAIAFGLNVVSFTANKKAGPLSMTVAANVKQVLSIVLAVVIFDLSISLTNATGILLTLAGGAWYAAVEYAEKKARGKPGI